MSTDTNNYPTWPGWETVRLIGRGSFGGVYEIRREMFGETEYAALKHLSIPQNDSEIDELRGEGLDDESITRTFRDHLREIMSEYSLSKNSSAGTLLRSPMMSLMDEASSIPKASMSTTMVLVSGSTSTNCVTYSAKSMVF